MKTIGIIGGGHNGLVCACYLQKAGFKVTIYEKEHMLGGMCSSREGIKNHTLYPCASYFGMLKNKIKKDLGLQFDEFSKSVSIVATSNEKFIRFDENESKFTGFNVSQKDLKELDEMYLEMELLSKTLDFFILDYNANKDAFQKKLNQLSVEPIIKKKIFDLSLQEYIKLKISNSELHLFLGETLGLPSEKGSFYRTIFAGTSTINKENKWGYCVGGMDEVVKQLEKKAFTLGVNILKKVTIKKVNSSQGLIKSIKDGKENEYEHDIFISNLDLFKTSKLLDLDVSKEIKVDLSGGKIFLSLKEAPKSALFNNKEIAEIMEIILPPANSSYDEILDNCSEGVIPSEHLLFITFPSLDIEKSAPEGRFLMCVEIPALPFELKKSDWKSEKPQLLNNIISHIESYFPNIKELIVESIMYSPLDYQREYHTFKGSHFHSAMIEEQLFEKRSFKDSPSYETPFSNLFLCGSGTHPGGTVSGANGHNCAKKIIDLITLKK